MENSMIEVRPPDATSAVVPVVSPVPRPGISLDSALGTFYVENVLKERMHVQHEETRFRGVRGSP